MVIRTRDNLIEFLEENASGRYLRALQNYNENLGAFSQVAGRNSPGWIVRVASKHGNIYYLAAVSTFYKLEYYIFGIVYNNLPWKYWIGDQSKNPLYQGDNPEKYKSLRDKELRNVETENIRPNTTP